MKYVLLLTLVVVLAACSQEIAYEPNPDPNHTHADFAVWIQGEHVDLTAAKYMSGLSTDDSTYDEEDEYLHQHLHLHDNVDYVVHIHKPGLTIGEFFESLGYDMTLECFSLDTGEEYCNDSGSRWQFFVNGKEQPMDPNYAYSDMDQLLLTYGSGYTDIANQLEMMTDDACLYSQTCPWRGDPPAENCIADPEVPCVPGDLDDEYEDLF